jgi:hypothetical protein
MSRSILRRPSPSKETDPVLAKHRSQHPRRVGLVIAALMVAILVVAFVVPAAANAGPSQNVIMGQVTGPNSIPLAHVKVQVLSGSTVVAQTMTGWKGNYYVSVPAGTYDVKFSRYSFEVLTDAAVVVAAPSTTLNATLTPGP